MIDIAILCGFLKQAAWSPKRMAIIAGALPYRDYNFFTRWLMKRIAGNEGGETDTSQNHEFTDWDEVANFAERCVEDVAAAYTE